MVSRKALFNSVFILGSLLLAFLPFPRSQAGGGNRIIELEASRFRFSPGVISVAPGDQVTINLTSSDVAHGLYIDGYDLALAADPGQIKSLTFTADQEGSFRIRCSISCGALHPFMIGKIQVGNNLIFLRGLGLSILALIGLLIRSKV